MNKLEGFYALNESNLPTVPWEKYTSETVLDDSILWTVRSAVMKGDDLNLPRLVGVTATEAAKFADSLLGTLSSNDLVICYPFFVALKSGVIDVSYGRIVIEAVDKDLWNLVTHNKKDVTIIFEEDDVFYHGDEKFLLDEELAELLRYCNQVKYLYKDYIISGKSVFLEWSYSAKSDLLKNPVGNKKLVFYEIRTV